MAEKLKLAQIRQITPNPVRGLTEFQPDESGEAVVDTSNLVVVNLVLRRTDAAKRHLKADPKHPSAIEHQADAKDTEDWANDSGPWDKRIVVTDPNQRSKKKKNR